MHASLHRILQVFKKRAQDGLPARPGEWWSNKNMAHKWAVLSFGFLELLPAANAISVEVQSSHL
jgi:hypothetical protein